MIIQVVLIIFILFVISRIAMRFKAGDMTGREFIIWMIFWLSVAVATILPQKTDLIAQKVGVERGADLLVYLSIVVLFFIVFKILVKLEKIDKDITKIVRDDAISRSQKDE